MEKLERTLSDVTSDLSKEPETTSKSQKVKKVAKGEGKKAAKKVGKKSKSEGKKRNDDGGDRILLADLASEAGITGASARRRLRAAELSPEGRWSWEPGSKALKEARKALGLDE